MNDVVVRVSGLGKLYIIGKKQAKHARRNLRMGDLIIRTVTAPARFARNLARGPRRANGDGGGNEDTRLWALRDVSFDVREGEVLGVIGRNGSGKSTLLKILARITEPTEGEGEIRGRVGSLLEVGTGFHPELTGRENVYLNGAILGMRGQEIESKFDEIVAFSEVERFLDTPVKFYSSGMYLRLAFAVAAHLEPEILIVDEVLAVGDVAFQKKCLNKMSEVSGAGRTVLFVSHNMSAIARLCPRSLWLESGRIQEIGDTDKVIQHYLASGISDASVVNFTPDLSRVGQFTSISVRNDSGAPSTMVAVDQPFHIRLNYQVRQPCDVVMGVTVRLPDGLDVLETTTADQGERVLAEPGSYEAHIGFPARLLAPGEYLLSAYLHPKGSGKTDDKENLLRFTIAGDPYQGAGKLSNKRKGILVYPFDWTIHNGGPGR